MFLTTHAAAGILISQRVESPLWAFWLAFLSHFILDFIPHGDDGLFDENNPKTFRRAVIVGVIDIATMISMVAILFETGHTPDFPVTFAGVAGAITPDLLSNVFPQFHKKYRDQSIVRFLNFIKSKVLRLDTIMRLHGRVHRWLHFCIRNVFDYRISPIVGYGLQAAILITLVITSVASY